MNKQAKDRNRPINIKNKPVVAGGEEGTGMDKTGEGEGETGASDSGIHREDEGSCIRNAVHAQMAVLTHEHSLTQRCPFTMSYTWS